MKFPNFVVNALTMLGTFGIRFWYFFLDMRVFSAVDRALYGVKLPSNYRDQIQDGETEGN